MIRRGEGEWPAVAMKLGDQYAFAIPRQLQAVVGI
jgi:hypothetical protein